MVLHIFTSQCVRRGEMTWLREVFSCCWSLSQTDPQDFDWLRELALSSTPVLLQWATWEAAQLCVNSKLRTPLGKPLDTFMAFEGNKAFCLLYIFIRTGFSFAAINFSIKKKLVLVLISFQRANKVI